MTSLCCSGLYVLIVYHPVVYAVHLVQQNDVLWVALCCVFFDVANRSWTTIECNYCSFDITVRLNNLVHVSFYNCLHHHNRGDGWICYQCEYLTKWGNLPQTKQGKSEGFESCDRPIVRKRPIWVKIGDVLYRVTLKFDGWPWKTIGHLSFAVSSFV